MEMKNIEHIIAVLGSLSILLHMLEVGCHAAGWTKYEGVFSQLGNFIKGFLGGMKPPTPPSAGVTAVILAIILCGTAHADVSILDTLKTLPSVKEGVMYDIRSSRVINTLAYTLVQYKGFEGDIAYVGVDGIGAIIGYDLSGLPHSSLPVLDLTQYLHVGFGVAMKTITTSPDQNTGDNRVLFGPQVSFKVKF